MADWQDVGADDGWKDVEWSDVGSEKQRGVGYGKALKGAFAGLGTTADVAASMLAGGAAGLFGQEEEQARIYRGMEERAKAREEWADLGGVEPTFGEKLVSTVATLPMQIAGAGLSPAETGKRLLEAGETLPTALKGAAVDAAGNIVGMVLPGFKQGRLATRALTGGAAGAGQEYATKAAIQAMAETEAGKRAFEPSLEEAAIGGILGGGVAAAAGRRVPTSASDRVNKMKQEAEASRPVEVPDQAQLEMFARGEEGLATPYEAGQLGVTEPVTPKLQRRQMELPFGEERGDIVGDIQGQLFRGDVTTPEARLGLQEAERATVQELKKGTILEHPPGEPLPYLQAPELPFNVRTRGQGGAINPEVFKEGFEKVKELANGIRLKAQALYDGELQIVALDKQGNELGRAAFEPTAAGAKGQDAKSFITKVVPEAQRQGLATEFYKFTSELGNDISPDTVQTEAGRALWKGFEQKGLAQQGRIRKQGGGVLFDFGKNKQEENQIDNTLLRSEDLTYIPEDLEVSSEVQKALAEGKDGKLFTYFQSGATSAAMKSGSAAIRAASRITQNGIKRAELLIRNHVFPAEQSLKKLDKQQIVDLHELFKDEMFSGQRMPADVLERNLSIKELQAYTQMRDLFDDALAAQNAERVASNKKPITAQEAYVSSRWSGDFRRPVHDKEGRLVWYLASNSKVGLEMQTKALLKQFPDLVVDSKKDHTVKTSTNKTDLQSSYSKLVDILGRDDPAVQKIKEAIEEQIVAEGELTRGQEKHFQRKAGIRGFVGDRPGLGVEVKGKVFSTAPNPVKEALAFFEQQLQYSKNAYTWSEMQKAADGIKQIVGNPELQQQQPNNVKYIREYFKNAIGLGEAKWVRGMEDSLREGLGVSPSILNDAVGGMKSFFILQHLATSAGYTASSLIQASNVMPYLMDLRSQGHKGNIGIALAVGVPAGMSMAVAHYLKAIGGEYISKVPNQFMKDAFQYAEDNGVTARSVYDESPLGVSFSKLASTANIAAKTITIPETFVRAVAFMSFAQMLKDGGQYKDMSKLFQKAEEMVNKSMVDYRTSEKPLLFSKAGIAGNFLNTLQTFPMSFYNQWAYMGGQAMKGNVLPFATALTLQYAISGVSGMPYFDDMTKLYALIKDNLLPTGTWAKFRKSKFLSDPKLWLLENAGQSALYGALSDKTGIGLTSRVAAPGLGAMVQSPIGPVVDIAEQLGTLGKAVAAPTEAGKWAQVAMRSAPTGLQGLVETLAPMEDLTYVERKDGTKVFMRAKDLEERKGTYARTPEEVAMRKWGLRSQKEVMSRDVTYATQQANRLLEEKSGELVGKFYDAARQGNVKKARELNKLYFDLTGTEISNTQIENQQKQEAMTDIERAKLGANTPQKIANIARMNKILKGASVENQ